MGISAKAHAMSLLKMACNARAGNAARSPFAVVSAPDPRFIVEEDETAT